MDLRTLLVTLLRRWYVVLPILALTAFISTKYMDSVKPDYKATGSVLILGPSQEIDTKIVEGVKQETLVATNPYVRATTSLNTAAAILTESIMNGPFRRNLTTMGLSSDIALEVGDKVPLISVEVVGESAEQALATRDATLRGIGDELQARQDAVGAAPHDRFATQIVGSSANANPVNAARDRAVAATAVVGIGAAVALALLFENIAASRRQRRRRGGEAYAEIGTPGFSPAVPGLSSVEPMASQPPAYTPAGWTGASVSSGVHAGSAIESLARAHADALGTMSKLFGDNGAPSSGNGSGATREHRSEGSTPIEE